MREGMRFRAARGMQPAMATLVLRAGRVKPVYLGHPWIFAQAVERVEGAPGAGDPVEVRDPRGNFIGRGFWSPKSAIQRVFIRKHEPVKSKGSPASMIRTKHRHRLRSICTATQ